MKRTFFSLAVCAAMAFGAASCSKSSEGTTQETGSAQLTINCDFSRTIEARANSTAKPTTGWANIKSLTLFLTNSGGFIQYVLPVNTPFPSGAGATYETIATANNLVQATYDVYLIANATPSTTSTPFGAAGTSPSFTLDAAGLLNKDINTLYFGTVTASGLPDGVANAYQEPTEIFWAKKQVTVGATPETVELDLTRAVSLLRVRINKDHVDAGGKNAGVTFDNATASLVLRKTAGSHFKAVDGNVGGSDFDKTMFSKKPFKTNNTPSDYNGDMGLTTGEFTCWNDYLILPGGDADVNSGFNIVVIGLAPVDYVPFGATTGLSVASPVFWTGGVSGVAVRNKIVELNLTLKSAGITGTIPPPATFGNIDVDAKLVEWGDISTIDMNM